MDADDDPFNSSFREVRLEQLRLMARQWIPENIGGLTADVEMMQEAALQSMLLQVRAAVTAAKREEQPYQVEDRVVASWRVPERPVRDGSLLWMGGHLSRRLGLRRLALWCLSHARQTEIVERRVVMMQKLHYYGCPHVRIGGDRSDVHLVWMASQSGQIEPDGTAG